MIRKSKLCDCLKKFLLLHTTSVKLVRIGYRYRDLFILFYVYVLLLQRTYLIPAIPLLPCSALGIEERDRRKLESGSISTSLLFVYYPCVVSRGRKGMEGSCVLIIWADIAWSRRLLIAMEYDFMFSHPF